MKEDFNKEDWMWCPRHKDFECSKEITPEMVIDKLNKNIMILVTGGAGFIGSNLI